MALTCSAANRTATCVVMQRVYRSVNQPGYWRPYAASSRTHPARQQVHARTAAQALRGRPREDDLGEPGIDRVFAPRRAAQKRAGPRRARPGEAAGDSPPARSDLPEELSGIALVALTHLGQDQGQPEVCSPWPPFSANMEPSTNRLRSRRSRSCDIVGRVVAVARDGQDAVGARGVIGRAR